MARSLSSADNACRATMQRTKFSLVTSIDLVDKFRSISPSGASTTGGRFVQHMNNIFFGGQSVLCMRQVLHQHRTTGCHQAQQLEPDASRPRDI